MAGIQMLAAVVMLVTIWQHTSAAGSAGHGGYAHSTQSISGPTLGDSHKVVVSDDHYHGKTSYDFISKPHYSNHYTVDDYHTKDHKSHHESRDGDSVHGSYQLTEPNGKRRIVHYTADKGGFRAQVSYDGGH